MKRIKWAVRMHMTCVAVLFAIFAATVLAGDSAASATNGAEPAPDEELLARIAALPDNTWLKLPPVKTTGDMGVLGPDYKRTGPTVRDYSNKMVWAPERKRALYMGGGHNTHPHNDVWEYDLPSNTWICLYGADPLPPSFKRPDDDEKIATWFKENLAYKDGFVRTLRGAPVRPTHTWWALAYDSDKRRLLFVDAHKALWMHNKDLFVKVFNLDPKDPIMDGAGSGGGVAWLFSFHPETREWKEVRKVTKGYEGSCLEYLPDSETVWWNSHKTYHLDAAKGEWVDYGTKPSCGVNHGHTAYEPETRKIVAIVGAETWAFDVNTSQWTRMKENGPCMARIPLSTFCYDSVARKFVLYTALGVNGKPAEPSLWLYDLAKNEWTNPKPQGEVPTVGNIAGYYDVARNVTVIYSNAATWVFRCKNAKK
ncbi:MAG: hypothetical protein L6R28_04250 [Planctomycetes bacterium]|nr:hypothetical protein [Planctomycetota bacterium]